MSGMAVYFTRRLLLVPVTVLVITFMVYSILRIVPGGPVEQAVTRMKLGAQGEGGGGGTEDANLDLPLDALKELEEYYALDKPVGKRPNISRHAALGPKLF